MLNDSKVISFLATADAERAKHFYCDLLGLTLVEEEQSALVFDAHGTMLRVSQVYLPTIVPYTVCGWQVADIHEKIHGLTARGVKFARVDFAEQDEDDVCTFPDGTMIAWFKDPDGNILSLTQFGHEIPNE